jgi:hypothetical protein
LLAEAPICILSQIQTWKSFLEFGHGSIQNSRVLRCNSHVKYKADSFAIIQKESIPRNIFNLGNIAPDLPQGQCFPENEMLRQQLRSFLVAFASAKFLPLRGDLTVFRIN